MYNIIHTYLQLEKREREKGPIGLNRAYRRMILIITVKKFIILHLSIHEFIIKLCVYLKRILNFRITL